MWSFLRGKKRSERPEEDVAPRHDALSALASERRENRDGAADRRADAAATTDDVGTTDAAGSADAPERNGGYEVVLDPHAEEIGAGIAPGQDEDDLPVTPHEHRPLSREARVADALEIGRAHV